MIDENMNPKTNGFPVTETMKAYLLSSAKWAKFLCIMACIGITLLILFAILMFALSSSSSMPLPGFAIGGGIYFLFIAVIWLFPVIKGFQFANGLKAACERDDESALERGFAGLRSYLRLWVIYTFVVPVVILLFYAIFFATIMPSLPGMSAF